MLWDLKICCQIPIELTLTLTFSLSVELIFGVILDTGGIRQAVTEFLADPPGLSADEIAEAAIGAGIKALGSFQLKDRFDGIDLPLLTLTGGIEVDVGVSVGGTVKFSAGGGFTGTYITSGIVLLFLPLYN